VKWFPAARRGLIAGFVVSGFGLASVYAALLTQRLVGACGVFGSMVPDSIVDSTQGYAIAYAVASGVCLAAETAVGTRNRAVYHV